MQHNDQHTCELSRYVIYNKNQIVLTKWSHHHAACGCYHPQEINLEGDNILAELGFHCQKMRYCLLV